MRYRITKNIANQFFLEVTVCGADVPYEQGMWKQIVGPCKSQAEAEGFYRVEKALEAQPGREIVWEE